MSQSQTSSPLQLSAHPFEMSPSTRLRSAPRLPRWRALIGALLNPGGANPRDITFVPWVLTLAVSGSAFGLFFLQTGLDRVDTGTADWTGVAALAGAGLLAGTAGILALALVAWVGLRLTGSQATAADLIRAFGLAYSPTLVAVTLGLLAHLVLGWRTAVAFGVPGVLWALGPINNTLRRLSQGKTFLSITLASVCGALLLLSWGLLGGI